MARPSNCLVSMPPPVRESWTNNNNGNGNIIITCVRSDLIVGVYRVASRLYTVRDYVIKNRREIDTGDVSINRMFGSPGCSSKAIRDMCCRRTGEISGRFED